MLKHPLPRLDKDEELRNLLLPYCRLNLGAFWKDKKAGHKVICGDCSNDKITSKLFSDSLGKLSIQDPPYNFIAFQKYDEQTFLDWSKKWIDSTYSFLDNDSSLYVWLGAEHKNFFQPLSSFFNLMSGTKFKSKNFITLRNQRGFGTQKNWMSVRQELFYFTKGNPIFNTNAEYTDIPKTLNGYYKNVNGSLTNNFERSKSNTIRAGNVWIDIQQVFYRMEENVNGCYSQKPLKAIERIILASSSETDIVFDYFLHSGTTLIASERLNRICFSMDIDPVYCEISIRRLEHFRKTGKTGWQNSNPFYEEIITDKKIKSYLKKIYKIEN